MTLAGAELADESCVNQVTLYAHVKNSRELKTRIALEELADRVADAVAGRAGKNALTAFANAYRDCA